MKKNYIMSYLIAVLFFSCVSCVFGANGMEKDYIITINGIEMYDGAAKVLLEQIIEDEKELVNIVDKNTEENLAVTMEVLKPKTNIFINNSKEMATVLKLIKKIKMHAKEDFGSRGSIKDKEITLMKLGNNFCISDGDDVNNEIILYVNDKLQITKVYIFRGVPSEIQKATPVPE